MTLLYDSGRKSAKQRRTSLTMLCQTVPNSPNSANQLTLRSAGPTSQLSVSFGTARHCLALSGIVWYYLALFARHCSELFFALFRTISPCFVPSITITASNRERLICGPTQNARSGPNIAMNYFNCVSIPKQSSSRTRSRSTRSSQMLAWETVWKILMCY